MAMLVLYRHVYTSIYLYFGPSISKLSWGAYLIKMAICEYLAFNLLVHTLKGKITKIVAIFGVLLYLCSALISQPTVCCGKIIF